MTGFCGINYGKPCSVRLNDELGITGRGVRGIGHLAKQGDLESYMEIVFEAHLPDGKVIKVFENGSCEGLPDGTFLFNRWMALLNYAAGLTKQALKNAVITDEQAACLFQGGFPARARAVRTTDGGNGG